MGLHKAIPSFNPFFEPVSSPEFSARGEAANDPAGTDVSAADAGGSAGSSAANAGGSAGSSAAFAVSRALFLGGIRRFILNILNYAPTRVFFGRLI